MPTSGPTPEPTTALLLLAARLEASWPNLERAAHLASVKRQEIASAIADRRLVPEDASLVVFGSLARGEWTSGSDVDWALLVDGPADDGHLRITHEIRGAIEAGSWNAPGPEQLFGELAISHELVHRIGGANDSNRNITQRILLLLESRSLMAHDIVRDRVVRVVLRRYLDDDLGYPMSAKAAARVPRFLLNDIVRYWRTMGVDFAAKRQARAGKGWPLRNFKLRVSRKLIFAAGLAACLSCRVRPPQELQRTENESEADYSAIMVDHLLKFADQTPLESVAWLALEFGAKPSVARDVFDAYESFLGILDDKEKRGRLGSLTPDNMKEDPLFEETRAIGEQFQRGLTELFFGTDTELTDVAQRYGVF